MAYQITPFPMTLKVIRLLHAISNVIFRTVDN